MFCNDVVQVYLACFQTAMTPELLRLQTYDRVFQRLVSTHKEIPLGIYRACTITKKDKVSWEGGGGGEHSLRSILFWVSKKVSLLEQAYPEQW